jgi:5-hydroxyisourate hydrolase
MAGNDGGRLTTHVLDTALGKPASGLKIDLFKVGAGDATLLKSVITNEDGRCDAPLLQGDEFSAGEYELHFHAGDYLRRSGAELSSPAFLEVVPIRFGMAEASHYHVPLLVSAYGYSTYRGS